MTKRKEPMDDTKYDLNNLPFFNGSRVVWYSGPHLKHGFYRYNGKADSYWPRHKIETIEIQKDGFLHEFQVDECHIAVPNETQKVLYGKSTGS